MNKNSYLVIQVERIKDGVQCYFAYSQRWNHSYNLVKLLKGIGKDKILSINICDTKKESEEIADFWNEGFKKSGTFYFA